MVLFFTELAVIDSLQETILYAAVWLNGMDR